MDLPKRKHPRLEKFDYSQNGYYYITINTKNDLPILSTVCKGFIQNKAGTEQISPAQIQLSPIGIVAEEQLFELEKRYPFVKIDKYVIMPNHIHFILVLTAVGQSPLKSSPRPTITDVICAYKSLTTIACNRADNLQGRCIFQASFYEHIIRSEKSYNGIWKYIDENPLRWTYERN